jgi:hypothetical protein
MVYNKRTHIEQEVKLKERGVHQTSILSKVNQNIYFNFDNLDLF